MVASVGSARPYVSISQTFAAAPSTTYKLSMLVNSFNGGLRGVTGIQALYQDTDLGTYLANTVSLEPFFRKISVWSSFTTDSTGVGKLEIRFVNFSTTGNYYHYLDDITVTRSST